ncbi:MAG: hypothetical protein AB8H47_17395 [Bacteroidia bacterium]
MNKLESKGQIQFWFVMAITIFPYGKTIAKHLFYFKESFSDAQIDLTGIDIGEALIKIAIITALFSLMNKGHVWAKHLFAAFMLIILIAYYAIPISFGNTEFYSQMSISSWKTRITNTALYFFMPPILLYAMLAIKAFLRFQAKGEAVLNEKINDLGT